ncbi:ATP-binding cassette domain-containing protein [Flavihumibacter sp. R14]|nr:ATP-binding cassette domain-containing protein [Flavihumibacter soli]
MKLFLKNVRSILRKHEVRRLMQLIVLDVIVSILDVLFLILLLIFIAFYTDPDQIIFSSVLTEMRVFQQPLLLLGIFCLLFGLKNFFAYYITERETSCIYSIASRIASDKLSGYLDGDYLKYVQTDSSVHIRHIHHDAIEFSHHVLRGIQQFISQFVLILIVLVPLLVFKPFLSLLLFFALVPPILLSGFLIRKRLRVLRLTGKVLYQQLIQYLKEAISGFVESNVYDKKQFFLHRFNLIQKQHLQNLSDQQISLGLPSRIMEVFVVFGLFILLLIHQSVNPGSDLGVITLGAFMAASYKVIPGIVKMMNALGQIRNYWFTVENLVSSEGVSSQVSGDAVAINSVQFSDVSYKFQDRAVLENLSFDIYRGDMMGVSGISGKGKTTMINLILGFLNPHSGVVKMNGNGLDRRQAWRRISYVKQQPFFIHDTLLRNITLDEATVDQVKLKEVMYVTGIDSLTETLSHGIETIVSESGKNLSGGQRQRVMLARALYKDFDVLILDEPFSQLDEEAELRILKHLQTIAGNGRIVILITHNEVSLSVCNKRLIIDGQA